MFAMLAHHENHPAAISGPAAFVWRRAEQDIR
jgi:hypothetical protein